MLGELTLTLARLGDGLKTALTSRSLRPNSNTSSISVSLVSFESPLSSSSSSSRRASSSSPPDSLSTAALRMASVLRWTRPEVLCVTVEAIAGAAKRSNPKKSAYLDQPESHAACNLNVKDDMDASVSDWFIAREL
ncbi:hypothetical protein FQN60_008242 [Etheostoma spectabile]|uniref:Uncharacterized protein n=1 Tax=Etheostoma spectabile TaxID=54343 RepID=A0A5J5CRR4_9PERO|nr:hypothetical protein FQN60_008242 [Etheostoma spectabile]